jgi:uncharacterized membrane protein YqgA involved in biofilm formation
MVPLMIGMGTILNAVGILIGGAVGLTVARQIPPARQAQIKIVLAALTVWVGLSMTWKGLNGSFSQVFKQFTFVILAMMAGKLLGQVIGIQRNLNRLGQYARERFAQSNPNDAHGISDGFITCTLLFCVGPMAILGAVEDGLAGNFKILAIKAAMDGLATMVFVTTFGWGAMLAVIPVVAYQGTITLLAAQLQPYLRQQELLDSVNATGGLLVFSLALVILELKKVELADYLPSLALAPLLIIWNRSLSSWLIVPVTFGICLVGNIVVAVIKKRRLADRSAASG